MDLLLGTFADAHLADMTDEQLDRYEKLLRESDPELYAWLTGKSPPPHLRHDVMELLTKFQFPARSF